MTVAYLPDGFESVCRVEKIHVRETRFGERFFCEMTTTSGQRIVWTQRLDSAGAEDVLLQWAAAVSGSRPEDYQVGPGALRVQELLRQAATSPEANDFTQRYVLVRVSRVLTKNGRFFSLHRFYPHPGGAPKRTPTEERATRPARKLRLIK